LETSDVQMAKDVQPDVVMIDRYQGELIDLERKIATQAAKLSSKGGSGGL